MQELMQHPLSAAFPQMTKAELAVLTDDIAMEGQREPITLFEGMVLDGWHRYCACRACGRVPFAVQLKEGIDPVAWVKSKNLHRRHLSASQRAAAIVACGEWAQSGDNQHTRGGETISPPTVKQMAEEAEVSTRTIQHAKKAHEAGKGGAVRDGEVSAAVAAGYGKREKEPDLTPIPSGKILVDEEEWQRIRDDAAQLLADNIAMGAVFDADDQLKAAMAENQKLRGRIDALELRVKGLMTEKAEAVKAVKKWKVVAEKAEKAEKK